MSSNDEPTDVQLDISKYEGHTPGPWHYEMPPEMGMQIKAGNSHVAELSFLMSNMSPETDDVNPTGLDPDAVDARLIADAPLLLEEVKRLRKELEWFKQAINITADHIPRRAHWDAYVAEMVEKGLWPDEPED